MSDPVLLFVYGTLRRGFHSPVLEKIADEMEWMGYAKIKGALYDIGEYPGAVVDEAGNFIMGEIVKINAPVKVLQLLDYYEGYNADDTQVSEYCRKKEWIETEDGNKIEAWIYWYNLPIDNKRRIHCNDYIKYLQNK